MSRRLCACLVLLALLAAKVCNAAAVERDWLTPGDGLLTYDDVHRREWLDLSVSRFDQFPAPRQQNAIAEIGPGGLFEGFTLAKRIDAIRLAHSAGINTGTSNLAINQVPTTQLIDLLGITVQGSTSIAAIGFIDDTDISPPFPPSEFAAEFLVHVVPSTGGGFAGLFVNSGDDRLSAISNGLMLYRTVPEPSSASLAVASICALLSILRPRYIDRR